MPESKTKFGNTFNIRDLIMGKTDKVEEEPKVERKVKTTVKVEEGPKVERKVKTRKEKVKKKSKPKKTTVERARNTKRFIGHFTESETIYIGRIYNTQRRWALERAIPWGWESPEEFRTFIYEDGRFNKIAKEWVKDEEEGKRPQIIRADTSIPLSVDNIIIAPKDEADKIFRGTTRVTVLTYPGCRMFKQYNSIQECKEDRAGGQVNSVLSGLGRASKGETFLETEIYEKLVGKYSKKDLPKGIFNYIEDKVKRIVISGTLTRKLINMHLEPGDTVKYNFKGMEGSIKDGIITIDMNIYNKGGTNADIKCDKEESLE